MRSGRLSPDANLPRRGEDGLSATQRGVFDRYPRKLYLPLSMDLLRDAAFWTVVLLAIGANRIREFSDAKGAYLLDLERVGGVEVLWRFVALLFPATVFGLWLFQRHHRATNGTSEPREVWRIIIGAGLALVAGGALMWAILLAGDVRLTMGPDLRIAHPDYYMDLLELEEIRSIDDVDVQSFSFYAIDLEGESGPIAAILIVTELESIHAFVDVDESELAFATRRRDERELRMKEPEREIWVTHALRERQNQAPGDQVVALDGSDAVVLGTATVAFGPADSDELILLVDLDDLLSWPYETAKYDFDEVFIDDFMVTASDGPLRDDSAEMRALTELSERKGYDVQTLRREPVTDSGALILLVLAYFALGAAAIRIAFGPVRRRRGADLANAEPAAELPQG